MIAKEFAKAILCQEEIKPCNFCEACVSFNGNNNPDIIIIDEEEKSIKTEKIKQMIKGVYEKPIKSSKKVYIINNSQNLTKEAQNSLLKTLEEPPEYAVIILITENENLLLNTIKSRCTKLKFKSLSSEDIKTVLKQKYNLENISETLLELAEGSISKAVKYKGKEEIFNNIKEKFLNIESTSKIDFLSSKDIIFTDKDDILETLNYINTMFYKKTQKDIKYINCIKIVEETKDRLKKNGNFDMSIDNLLLNVWEEVNG